MSLLLVARMTRRGVETTPHILIAHDTVRQILGRLPRSSLEFPSEHADISRLRHEDRESR
jgi:hypothetical protein